MGIPFRGPRGHSSAAADGGLHGVDDRVVEGADPIGKLDVGGSSQDPRAESPGNNPSNLQEALISTLGKLLCP